MEQGYFTAEPYPKFFEAAKGRRRRKGRRGSQGGMGRPGLEGRQHFGSSRSNSSLRCTYVEFHDLSLNEASSGSAKVSKRLHATN
jgi:hypothetical protein